VIDAAWRNGDLEAFVARGDALIASSAEWTTPRPIHLALIVEATSYGILSADFWFQGYQVPPHFEEVLNWVAFCVQREWTGLFAELSLNDLEAWLLQTLLDNPYAQEWNGNLRRNTPARRYYESLKNAERGYDLETRPFLTLKSAVRNAARMVDREWSDRVVMNQRLKLAPEMAVADE
jgi:hypothetical protein